ncbi:MAG: ATP-dependent RecD-like DNA helicase [bacterium]
MQTIICNLKNVIFESKENNFQIVSVYTDEGRDIIISGYFQAMIKEVSYEVEGEFVVHPKFGEQLQVKSIKKKIDTSRQGIVEYLSSNFFPGVGEKYATEIYDKLGSNCLELIVENKEVLNKTNLSNRIKEILYNSLIQNKSLEELFVKMHDSGLTTKNIMKLYEKYQDRTLNHIYNDPYNLIYELDGFGFKKADSLAIKLGFSQVDNKRIQALLMYAIFNLSDSFGMSYVSKDNLYTEADKYNKEFIEISVFEKGLNNLIAKGRLIVDENNIYLKHIYEAELQVSGKIKLLKGNTKFKKSVVEESLSDYQEFNNIAFSEDQISAMMSSLVNKVSIVTGGPGTGKTTIVKGIIDVFAMLNSYNLLDDKALMDIKLLAPTGKAAKRLREKCNFPAETIHRCLGIDLEGNFLYHEDNLLPAKLIVIDEVSMIDLVLANNLLKAISKNAIVVFVGDKDQLPSIACGEILNDLINSKIIKLSVLTTIYRQKNNSGIVNLAKMINNGVVDENVFHENNDLHFVPCKDSDISNLIIRYIAVAMKQGYDLKEDITVLIPMYKGVNGIDNINTLVSETYNKDYKFTFSYKDKTFKQNDKVIQLINSKEQQIYNGDIGFIDNKVLVQEDDSEKEKVNIVFDNKIVKFNLNEFDNIKLAYATSIHKSQGSEYKVVIIPITKAHNIMLKRKLLYTGVTRAKEKLILIGDYDAFIKGINKIEDKRYSTLCYRLNNETKNNLTPINDPSIPFDTLGEINMENITPYSFM